MAQYELSQVLSKFMDRHLVFPILEFHQEKGIYDPVDIMKAKLALLQNTNMVDFSMDIYKVLNDSDDVPQQMVEQRSEVVARLRKLQHDVDPIIKCLENSSVVRNFRQDRAFNVQVRPGTAASACIAACRTNQAAASPPPRMWRSAAVFARGLSDRTRPYRGALSRAQHGSSVGKALVGHPHAGTNGRVRKGGWCDLSWACDRYGYAAVWLSDSCQCCAMQPESTPNGCAASVHVKGCMAVPEALHAGSPMHAHAHARSPRKYGACTSAHVPHAQRDCGCGYRIPDTVMELAVVHAQNHCGMAGAVGADVFYVFHVPPPLRPTPAAAHDPRSGIRSGAGACHCRTCFGSLLVHALCIMCPLQNFQEARDDINKLKDAIDNQTFAAPLAQLQQRTWLLHWSLFVFWNHESGRNDLIDLFMLPPYMSAIQINAPHLLRYLAFAVLVQRRRRNAMKDLIKVIQQESYE
eukprot:353077-Chlamydomonas_euryale.AAC.13